MYSVIILSSGCIFNYNNYKDVIVAILLLPLNSKQKTSTLFIGGRESLGSKFSSHQPFTWWLMLLFQDFSCYHLPWNSVLLPCFHSSTQIILNRDQPTQNLKALWNPTQSFHGRWWHEKSERVAASISHQVAGWWGREFWAGFPYLQWMG